MASSSGNSVGAGMESVKDRVFGIIESSKSAISEEELSMRMGNIDKMTRMNSLNALISEKKIRLTLGKNGGPQYEIVIEEQSPEDMVLAVIKESGRNGIWIRDIRFKTKLSQVVLNKALKSLEGKKLIRSVKSISNRKLFVLFDLEPDESITGGACYDSGFIREDVVKNLKSTCFQYLYDRFQEAYQEMTATLHSIDSEPYQFDKIYVSASEVFNDLAARNIFQDIKLGDIEHILNILSYECKLNKKLATNKTLYRYNPYNRDKTDMFYSPCMVCHLYKDCKPGSVHISPETCHYLSVEKF